MVGMNIQDFLTTYAPSSHAVEKTLNILSALAPHPDSVWKILNTLATFAPNASSVWMFPLAALVLAVVHAMITRRAGMMVGAAFILCFYTVGHILLPTAEVSNEKQMALLMTLHTWFSCIAAYIFFVCIAASLAGHFIAMGWRHYRTRVKKGDASPVATSEAVQPLPKRAPVPRPRKAAVIDNKPKTINELAAVRASSVSATSQPKKFVRKEPTL